ncbi:Fucose 4-O-acetylase [Amphibacillus marinus]|uniref:Fucose 4-O-acetylase n=1 Tax=Amphibacillus marinus TaxID=872970 RepID=A0A1H8MYF9_9BACI|nr:acyltransferase family protein [Amphibacillus marinus]SEO22320.1 Fucose 4-O-acetylase [Amphibacillus marinus]
MQQREAFFDNGKLILIFLVVFGHVIQPLTTESLVLLTLYRFIYLFHMPAIILLSGFFAKGIGEPKYLLSLIRKLIVPYLIFQTFYTALYYFTTDSGWDTPLFEPHWSLWFLLSLFSWHILLILYKRLPAKLGIGLTIIIGLLIGYMDGIGHEFSLSRTFVFFPFFLVGYWLSSEQLRRLSSAKVRAIALLVMAGVIIVLFIGADFQIGWLFGSGSYASLDRPNSGALIRLLVYLVAFVLSFSFYAWTPRKSYRLTKFGQQTIYVYLLHGFFVQAFREYETIQINDGFDFVVAVFISIAIVLLLASKPIFISFQPIIETKATELKNLTGKPG